MTSVLTLTAALIAAQALPRTPKKPVETDYAGSKVSESYRWLENGSDPAVKRWSEAQNRVAREVLARLPGRDILHQRISDLLTKREPGYTAAQTVPGHVFAMKFDPARQQQMLVEFVSPGDRASERLVADPNEMEPKGRVSIDFYVPSLDGRLVAVALSKDGSESGGLHIFETATGRELPDRIERVQAPTAGGSFAWTGSGDGIYYTRYPRQGERPEADLGFYQQVWFHKLGTSESADVYELGKDLPRIAEILLESSEDGRYVLANVLNGDGGEHAFYLRAPAGGWTRISGFADRLVAGRIGRDGAVWLKSIQGAPRGKIVRVPLETPSLAQARTVIEEQAGVIDEFEPAASRLYVAEMVGGPSRIRVFDLAGKELASPAAAPVSSVFDLRRMEGDALLFGSTSYTEPPAYFRLDPAQGKLLRTALARRPSADFSDTEVVREECTSRDGTKVPLSILRRKGTRLDGKNPAVLYGYGGYGVNLIPWYSDLNHLWIENGVVYAVANLRGGAEFGDEWHQAGRLTRKQNVFDDFAACARHLIEAKYTSPERLAIEGASNGGLLMGAALTQHPELFRAVVSWVGIYDMLRVELSPNGTFNVTEFGTVKDPEQFRALRAYSPYHNVKDGVAYPSVLLVSGENDGRVDPMQSRKMAARLQAASSSKRPVLLRTSSTAGHGFGTSLDEKIEQATDTRAFTLHELGVTVQPPRKPSL